MVKVTYYLEVISSWCYWAEPAWADLKKRYEGAPVRFDWKIALMDDVYGMLVTIDFPDGLTGGLRRSTDALRAVLERTRGDVTTTIVATRLQAAIEGRTSTEGPTGF